MHDSALLWACALYPWSAHLNVTPSVGCIILRSCEHVLFILFQYICVSHPLLDAFCCNLVSTCSLSLISATKCHTWHLTGFLPFIGSLLGQTGGFLLTSWDQDLIVCEICLQCRPVWIASINYTSYTRLWGLCIQSRPVWIACVPQHRSDVTGFCFMDGTTTTDCKPATAVRWRQLCSNMMQQFNRHGYG